MDALVTGAMSTLGYAISGKLHEHGYTVYGTARDTFGKVFPFGRLIGFDFGDDDYSFLSGFEGLDLLVNNAGIFTEGGQETLSDDDFLSVMDVNVVGLFRMTRACLPLLRRRNGAVVNVSSINALHPGFGSTAHYDGSKGFVSAYTRSLAAETGLRVNAVAPGLVDASRLRGTPLAETYSQHSVFGGMVKAGDVASAVLFLASSRGIYGQTLVVDNGYLLK